MSLGRLRAVFGIDIRRISAVMTRAQGMYDGLEGDPSTYANPTLPLPAFLDLIANLGKAQQAVKTRVVGAREKRDVQHGLLLTGMETERMFVQSLADANPSCAASLITSAGLVVATAPVHVKAMLTLRNGKQSGSVRCEAHVALLIGAGAKHPTEKRYFGWQYTTDGGKTFVTMVPTPAGKVVIEGLTPLTTVGVRVNMTNSEGPGDWSQLVTILVL
jgi:hypothetical protein